MKILVTGASGFIGGRLVELLATVQDYEILATGRSETDKFRSYSNVSYFKLDLKDRIQELSCNVCIHCAGLADDRSSIAQLIRNNISATENLLKGLKDCSLFIFISSASVYDFSNGNVQREEDVDVNNPLSLYGKSKLVAENRIVQSGIDSIYILRPRAVYGPGDRVLLPRILRLIKGKRMILPGNLSKKTSLTHIDNLCEAVLISILHAKPGVHIYNIADKQNYDLNAVFQEILNKKIGKVSLIRIPDSVVKFIVYINKILGIRGQLNEQTHQYLSVNSLLNIDKAEEHLNYTGRHEFYNSIHELDI